MKILHVYKTYYPDTFGGVEYFIQTLSKGMMEKEVYSAVFCLTHEQSSSELIIDGIKVYKIPYLLSFASTPISFKFFFKFVQMIKEFDIIHYHFPYPFADVLFLFFGRSKRSIVTYHSDIVKQKILSFFYKPLEALFLNRIGKIVATSPVYVETSPVLRQYKHKTIVIPLAINEKKINVCSLFCSKKLKDQFGEKFFLFIGVLRYYKGLHTLIDAAKETGFPVVIAGDGPLKESLQKQAKNYSNIYFLGPITEQQKDDLLSCCHAFVFPSHLRSEAFGFSLLEASMHKKPMITCDIGTGTSYINIHEETGLVIQKDNSKALSKAMKTLFENEKLSKKFGKNAYKRLITLFTASKMVSAYKSVYEDLMD